MAATEADRPTLAAETNVLPPGFRSKLFAGLTPSEIKAVLAAARLRRIFPGDFLQNEGEPGTHWFLLVTGRAAAYKTTPEGRRLFVRWIAPGDAFGLTAMQGEPPPLITTVQAVREGSVFVWEHASARTLISQHPRLCENFHAVVTHYLGLSIDLLVARASQNAQQRLARTLVESARQIGRARRDGIEFDLTNEQLAEMADVSLFTASRQLSEWCRQGIVARSRGKILLRAPERLVSQHF